MGPAISRSNRAVPWCWTRIRMHCVCIHLFTYTYHKHNVHKELGARWPAAGCCCSYCSSSNCYSCVMRLTYQDLYHFNHSTTSLDDCHRLFLVYPQWGLLLELFRLAIHTYTYTCTYACTHPCKQIQTPCLSTNYFLAFFVTISCSGRLQSHALHEQSAAQPHQAGGILS